LWEVDAAPGWVGELGRGKGAHLGEQRDTAGWDCGTGRGRGERDWEGLGRREPAGRGCTREGKAQLDVGGASRVKKPI
jgi:hypothetical protein